MAEIIRSYAEITALLPDNPNGDISAEDIREIFESFKPGWAYQYITTPAVTTISVAGTAVKAAGTTALGASGDGRWTMPASNRLQLSLASLSPAPTAPSRLVRVIADFSISLDSGSLNDIAMYIAKGPVGTVAIVSDTKILHRVADASDIVSGSVSWIGSLAADEVVELWVANDTGTNDVQVDQMNMSVQDFVE